MSEKIFTSTPGQRQPWPESNEPLRVFIASIEILDIFLDKKMEFLLLFLIAVQGFSPLPPDLPFPSMQTRVPVALNRGAILQLWGHSQAVALTNPEVPLALKTAYGFDMVIIVPREAHNSMCGVETHGQQCNVSDVLSVEQFNNGIEMFKRVNMSLILYTSIMHCGHSVIWENGTLDQEHPEWLQYDELGQVMCTLFAITYSCSRTL